VERLAEEAAKALTATATLGGKERWAPDAGAFLQTL